jgi:D-alanine-D-alanine ligase
LRVAMIFGGRSVEHEVSVITAHQAMAALPADRFTAVPVYIARSGQWYTGDALLDLRHFNDLDALQAAADPVLFSADATRPGLVYQRPQQPQERRGLFGGLGGARTNEPAFEPLDIAFPLVHGSHGEDGTLQGLFELADLPYVGSGVAASAVGMDKVLAKVVLRGAGLPIVPELALTRARWERETDGVLDEVESRFGYPVFVKPVSLGSSIGVSRADDREALRFALDVAAAYDARLMVEPAQQGIIEINCSVLGAGDDVRASVCEQPVSEGLLSYQDKYLPTGGGAKGSASELATGAKSGAVTLEGSKSQGSQGMASAKRLIPAPIAPDLTSAIQDAAKRTFVALGAAGVARIDFLVRPEDDTFFVNEINTMPGSLSFYLWEPAGVPFPDLLATLIAQAQARQREKRRSTYAFESSLLRANALLGAKTIPSAEKS